MEDAASTGLAPPAYGGWSDWAGVVASIGCAIHCAAMPFVIGYLPALGLSFLADTAFHQWMAVGCFLIALIAFVPGLRRHGQWTPVTIAGVGLAMISFAAFGFAGECCPTCDGTVTPDASIGAAACTDDGCLICAEGSPNGSAGSTSVSGAISFASSGAPGPVLERIVPWLTPLGGVVLVSAHVLNRRYGCQSDCCGGENSEEAIG